MCSSDLYAGRAYRPGQRRNPFLGRHPGFRVGGERFQQHLGGSVLAQYRPPIPQLHRHRDGRPDPLARGQHDGRLSAPVLRRGEYVPRHPSFETFGPGHHLGQLHPDLCRRAQYESLVAQRWTAGGKG